MTNIIRFLVSSVCNFRSEISLSLFSLRIASLLDNVWPQYIPERNKINERRKFGLCLWLTSLWCFLFFFQQTIHFTINCMYKDSTVLGLWHVGLFTDKAGMYMEKDFPSTPISTETETREKAHLRTIENYIPHKGQWALGASRQLRDVHGLDSKYDGICSITRVNGLNRYKETRDCYVAEQDTPGICRWCASTAFAYNEPVPPCQIGDGRAQRHTTPCVELPLFYTSLFSALKAPPPARQTLKLDLQSLILPWSCDARCTQENELNYLLVVCSFLDTSEESGTNIQLLWSAGLSQLQELLIKLDLGTYFDKNRQQDSRVQTPASRKAILSASRRQLLHHGDWDGLLEPSMASKSSTFSNTRVVHLPAGAVGSQEQIDKELATSVRRKRMAERALLSREGEAAPTFSNSLQDDVGYGSAQLSSAQAVYSMPRLLQPKKRQHAGAWTAKDFMSLATFLRHAGSRVHCSKSRRWHPIEGGTLAIGHKPNGRITSMSLVGKHGESLALGGKRLKK
ncbi:uncharacterized protein CLUP02_00721 [Colletotrichum lupini]|uniref:Uncharacterized protein n=1 Tax=Colletotrichum lupini TaxID=145971 RepID=A0A9Q8SAY9_9PEZI|nr:uncharacterized protein CLUP02_00721 [Colletotrichum lupini]UQC74074.1 hypothetical protein CLUP02_00721 [Colletotrichum lupini]